jgi:hypothetical protein
VRREVIVGIWSGFVRIVRVTSEESFVRGETGIWVGMSRHF